MELSDGESLILVMLSEVYRHLDIQGEIDAKFVQAAIFNHQEWGLRWKYPSIFVERKDNPHVVNETADIMSMWSVLETAYNGLWEADKKRVEGAFGKEIVFPGFDANHEPHYRVARFLIDDLEKFQAFKGRDLDTHRATVDGYQRMLAAYTPIASNLASQGGRSMNIDQIIEVLVARHPEQRG
jgi:uncharacterized protein